MMIRFAAARAVLPSPPEALMIAEVKFSREFCQVVPILAD